MANPVTCVHLITNGSSSGSSFTTARTVAEPNRLLLLGVQSGRVGAAPAAPTVSGMGLTWVQQDTVLWDTGATQRRLTLFRAYGSGAVSGALTISFAGVTQDGGCNWQLSEYTYVDDTSGTNGSVAVVQSVNASGSSTTPAVTLAAFGDTDNATYGLIGHTGTGAITAGTGFVRIQNLGNAGMAIAAEFRPDNDTGVDGTITSSAWGCIGVEIKAGADPSIPTSLPTVLGNSTGTNYYVSTSGSNANPGTAIGSPKLNLDNAIAQAITDGNFNATINVRYDSGAAHVSSGTAGTAAGERITVNCVGNSKSDPLTICTYPSDLGSGKALINGELAVYGASNQKVGNVRLQNLDIRKRTAADNASSTSGDYGVRVGYSRNVEISGCNIQDNNQGGVLVGEADRFHLVENVQIFGCAIHDTGSGGANHNSNKKHDHPIYWGGGSADCVYGGAIYNNLLYVARFGFCAQLWGSGGGGTGTFSNRHCLFVYNTLYDSDTQDSAGNSNCIIGGGNSGMVDGVISSNIMKKTGTAGTSYGIEQANAGTGTLVKFNLIHENRDGDIDPATSGHITASNNLTGQDPLLTDPGSANFHIPSNSPAKGAGESQYKPSTDYYGTTRTTADIGAVAADSGSGGGSGDQQKVSGAAIYYSGA